LYSQNQIENQRKRSTILWLQNREMRNLDIRCSTEDDRTAIRHIHETAFGAQGREIADLVDGLLADETARPLLSLVAETGGRPVGHVIFSRVTLQPENQEISARILAPLAVMPEFQRKGVGGLLISEGFRQLKASGVQVVFVLGDPGYYMQHGFQAAGAAGLAAPHSILPEHADAWMVVELVEGVLGTVRGTVQCANVLNQPQHWRE
jgi:putative acetyltransferase